VLSRHVLRQKALQLHLRHLRSMSGNSSKFEVSSILFTSICIVAGRSLDSPAHTCNNWTVNVQLTTWVGWHQKGQTSLDFNEAREDGMAVASAGPYANHCTSNHRNLILTTVYYHQAAFIKRIGWTLTMAGKWQWQQYHNHNPSDYYAASQYYIDAVYCYWWSRKVCLLEAKAHRHYCQRGY